jgi:hypothetical protein
MMNLVQQTEQLITLESTLFVRSQAKIPPGRTGVVQTITFSGGQKGLIPDDGLFTLINIARWRFWSAGGRLSWRLNRMPLRPEDMDGDRLSSSGYSLQQAALNTFLLPGRYYNSHGELLTTGEVEPRLAMWQLRDGTKRRRRNPLAP